MSIATSAHSPNSPSFWKAYGIQMRPYLLFVSGITGLTGLSVSEEATAIPVLILTPVFFVTYGFGQALTDCFQTDTDSISASYRPLVRGEVHRRDVMVVSMVGLFACGTVLTISNPATLPLVALCIFGLATYSHFKRRWWGGPFYNAWIVAALFGIAVLAVHRDADPSSLIERPVVLSGIVVFCAYANFVLAGYFKDIDADRLTGYETLPVRFGRRISAVASDVLAAAGGVGAAFVIGEGGVKPGAVGFLTAALVLGIVAQVRLHRISEDREAYLAISPVVHTYILLLASITVHHRPNWALPLLLYYGTFVAALRARPVKSQI